MRRRQIYQMQREAQIATPATFTGGPLTYGTPVSPAVRIIDPHACRKCGRTVGRGRHLHEKHCRGAGTIE